MSALITTGLPKAMIFAAGLGTRLKPFTDNHPKALAEVNGKTLLQRNIEYLKDIGVTELTINVHHFADQIVDFLIANEDFDIEIKISHEVEEPLETGGGLVHAKKLLGEESVLVMNVDILTDMRLEDFIQFHYQYQPMASLAVSDRNSTRKLLFDRDKRLRGWKNYVTGEQISNYDGPVIELAFSGLHIVNPSIFNYMPKSGKFSIIDTYLELMDTQRIMGFDHSGGIVLDVGKPESIAEAEKLFK